MTTAETSNSSLENEELARRYNLTTVFDFGTRKFGIDRNQHNRLYVFIPNPNPARLSIHPYVLCDVDQHFGTVTAPDGSSFGRIKRERLQDLMDHILTLK